MYDLNDKNIFNQCRKKQKSRYVSVNVIRNMAWNTSQNNVNVNVNNTPTIH